MYFGHMSSYRIFGIQRCQLDVANEHVKFWIHLQRLRHIKGKILKWPYKYLNHQKYSDNIYTLIEVN